MKLTASDFDKLRAFYREEDVLSLRPGKRLLAWLEEHFDVRVTNNVVTMDAKTKVQIRQLLEQENPNFNVKAGLPRQVDHMTMSEVMRDEKLGSVKPDEKYVLVKGYTNGVYLINGKHQLPKKASLRIPANQIRLDAYNNLLVVENLDVFDVLPDYDIPIAGSVLLVYRGHDKGTSKGLKALLERAKNHCRVNWFPDFDPKGLELVFAEDAVSQILSVDIETDIAKLKQLSNPDKYLKQSQSVNSLKTSQCARHPLIECLIGNQLAIMQQHILSHQLRLTIHKR